MLLSRFTAGRPGEIREPFTGKNADVGGSLCAQWKEWGDSHEGRAPRKGITGLRGHPDRTFLRLMTFFVN